jgi:hypothetical protein
LNDVNRFGGSCPKGNFIEMQNTDPVQIKDIEEAAELNSDQMAEIKGGVNPLQAQAGASDSDATTNPNGKVSNSGITVA